MDSIIAANIKKYKFYISIIIISIFFVVLFFLYYKVYGNTKTVYLDNKTIVYIGNIPRKVEKECEKWIARADEVLPPKLAKDYKEKIYIMDTNHFKEVNGKAESTVKAVAFLAKDKYGNPIGIYINADDILKQDNGMLVTVCHEYGHYLDTIIGNPSHSDEWAKITKEEYKKLVRPNEYYKDPIEFFAETFAWYCLSDESIGALNKSYCPQAWDYINLIIKEYEQEVSL